MRAALQSRDTPTRHETVGKNDAITALVAGRLITIAGGGRALALSEMPSLICAAIDLYMHIFTRIGLLERRLCICVERGAFQ